MTTSLQDQSQLRHGSKVGRFVVVGELGSGGMGVVYAAHDRELDRQVALKVMRGTTETDEDRLRMLREGQAMARITHPNVITVFEVGTENGVVFLAQELLDGGTLAQWLEHPHTQHEIIRKFVAAGRGLAAAHAAGLVHRDFKPDNVLLGRDGRVRVADFGLARTLGGADTMLLATAPGGGSPTPHVAHGLMSNLTKTGAVMGTPMYMAPEQHEGLPTDARCDQFAFCVALYHALYGAWPFEGKTSIALADNVVNGVIQPPPKSAKVPGSLRKLLLRGLSTMPADRFSSMDELLSALTARPKRNPVPFVLGGLLVLVVGAVGSYLVLNRETVTPPRPTDTTIDKAPDMTTANVNPITDTSRDLDPRWLSEALDLGQLDAARRKLDDDALLLGDPVKVSIARSAAAYLLLLRGELRAAEAKLEEAQAGKGTNPIAIAYADLAAAAIASARGELAAASKLAAHCVTMFEATAPIVSSICRQIQGESEADQGNAAAARQAYDAGLVLADQAKDAERISGLSLALAQLDFDEKQEDLSLDTVAKLQREARRRGAVSGEANAAVLASRIRVAKADTQGALAVFDEINPDVLQAYRTKTLAKIALGQIYGYRTEADEDGVVGLDRIADALTDARTRGFVGLALEAHLARVLVELVTGDDRAAAERAALIEEATTRGYKRIAKLATSYNTDPLPPETPSIEPPRAQ